MKTYKALLTGAQWGHTLIVIVQLLHQQGDYASVIEVDMISISVGLERIVLLRYEEWWCQYALHNRKILTLCTAALALLMC